MRLWGDQPRSPSRLVGPTRNPPMRTFLVGVVLFILGVSVGLVAPGLWPARPVPDGMESRWEATLYLPAPMPGDPYLNEDAYKAALAEFTRPFGGATLV